MLKPSATTSPKSDRFYTLAWPHADAVLQTARYISRDDTEAEDLTQETMFKAYRRIDSLREDARAQQWLRAILRNTHIDRARVHRRPELSLDELEFDPADANPCDWSEPTEPSINPDRSIDGFGDEDMIAALKKLPRDIRWTLLLVDVEGMPDADAARALKVPVGTIKSRLHRGRNMLRTVLYPIARDLHLAV